MTRMLPLVALIAACGPGDDGPKGFTTTHSGTQDGSCDVLQERAAAVDEQVVAPLGFSAQNALDEITGVTNTTNIFEYPDTTTINLEIEFVYTGGPVTYVEREVVGVLPQNELDKCVTALEIEGTFSFMTGDGSFDEEFTGVLSAIKRREGVFAVELPSPLTGTWTPEDSDIDSGAYPGLVLELDGWIDPGGSGGEIVGVSGDDRVPAGTWAPPVSQG